MVIYENRFLCSYQIENNVYFPLFKMRNIGISLINYEDISKNSTFIAKLH